MVRDILRKVAMKHGIDQRRLVVHSIRYGAPTQMDASGFSDADKCVQGGWRSVEGMRAYVIPSLALSDRSAAAIHDPPPGPTSPVHHTYSEPWLGIWRCLANFFKVEASSSRRFFDPNAPLALTSATAMSTVASRTILRPYAYL